jgi:hypothetical protein
MPRLRGNATIGEAYCELMDALFVGDDANGRRGHAVKDGAVEALVGMVKDAPSLEPAGRAALASLIGEDAARRERALAAGARADWLPGGGIVAADGASLLQI